MRKLLTKFAKTIWLHKTHYNGSTKHKNAPKFNYFSREHTKFCKHTVIWWIIWVEFGGFSGVRLRLVQIWRGLDKDCSTGQGIRGGFNALAAQLYSTDTESGKCAKPFHRAGPDAQTGNKENLHTILDSSWLEVAMQLHRTQTSVSRTITRTAPKIREKLARKSAKLVKVEFFCELHGSWLQVASVTCSIYLELGYKYK